MRFLLAGLALSLGSFIPGAQDDISGQASCLASWRQADTNGDGILDGREATLYLAMMYAHKATPPADGRIDQAHFIDACLAGLFRMGFTPD